MSSTGIRSCSRRCERLNDLMMIRGFWHRDQIISILSIRLFRGEGPDPVSVRVRVDSSEESGSYPSTCTPEYGMLRPLRQQAVADFIKQKQHEGTRMAKISFDRPLEVKNDKAASILIKAAKGSRKPIKRIDISRKLESGRSSLKKRYFR